MQFDDMWQSADNSQVTIHGDIKQLLSEEKPTYHIVQTMANARAIRVIENGIPYLMETMSRRRLTPRNFLFDEALKAEYETAVDNICVALGVKQAGFTIISDGHLNAKRTHIIEGDKSVLYHFNSAISRLNTTYFSYVRDAISSEQRFVVAEFLRNKGIAPLINDATDQESMLISGNDLKGIVNKVISYAGRQTGISEALVA